MLSVLFIARTTGNVDRWTVWRYKTRKCRTSCAYIVHIHKRLMISHRHRDWAGGFSASFSHVIQTKFQICSSVQGMKKIEAEPSELSRLLNGIALDSREIPLKFFRITPGYLCVFSHLTYYSSERSRYYSFEMGLAMVRSADYCCLLAYSVDCAVVVAAVADAFVSRSPNNCKTVS